MTNIVRLIGLVVLVGMLEGCGGLSKEQQAQAISEVNACFDQGSRVERIYCKWGVIESYQGTLTPYDQLAYARELQLAEMVDRGEITPAQGIAAYKEYYAQVQLAMRQEAFARQEMNRVVMSGLNSLDQPQPQSNRATCTSTRFGNSVTTQCY